MNLTISAIFVSDVKISGQTTEIFVLGNKKLTPLGKFKSPKNKYHFSFEYCIIFQEYKKIQFINKNGKRLDSKYLNRNIRR